MAYAYILFPIFFISLSVEKLSIYISLKEKVSLRRRNKFVALHRHFIMKQEEEVSGKVLEVLLERRKDVVFEIWTRSYEEERRRAEDEVMQVSEYYMAVFECLLAFFLGCLTFYTYRKRGKC